MRKRKVRLEEREQWHRLQEFIADLPEDALQYLLKQDRWTFGQMVQKVFTVPSRFCLIGHLRMWTLSRVTLLAIEQSALQARAAFSFDDLCRDYRLKHVVAAIKAFIRSLK